MGPPITQTMGPGERLYGSSAHAQQRNFYLDRLQIGGSPQDGFALWRPRMTHETVFFGQAALGWQHRPLLGSTVAANDRMAASVPNPVQDQITTYLTAGLELMERMSFAVTLPVVAYQHGSNPCSGRTPSCESVDVNHVVPSDVRVDARVIAYRSDNRRFHLGAALNVWVPSGDSISFTTDDTMGAAGQVLAEYDFGAFALTGNTGLHFRPNRGLNKLRVGSEWIWAVGGFIPMRDGAIRLGGELFGSTGIVNAGTAANAPDGATFLTKGNTPIGWMGEVRLALDKKRAGWAGFAGGTRMSVGYGAPDIRILASIGYAFPIRDTNPKAPPPRFAGDAMAEPEYSDRDGDGIPDDIDACPDEPEDGRGPFPNDGCPAPDEPVVDTDNDGIPDSEDACPKEPGVANPDPKLHGCPQFIRRVEGSTEIQILKRVEFKTNSTELLPQSFPILDEVYALLSVNPDIIKVNVEGHTDNRGGRPLNIRLSQGRSESVMKYLVNKGIDASRLSARGYAFDRPIDTNETDEGRQRNRRVEFHITE